MKRTLREPKKPEKEIRVDKNADFFFTKYNPKISSVKELLDWIEETLPESTEDTSATVELVEEWCYDDCTTYLRLGWSETVPNPNYEKQLKKYEKQLDKWKKQNG